MNKIISVKDGITFTKIDNNIYTFSTSIIKNDLKKKLLNLDITFFNIIYDIKQNLTDKIHLHFINNNELIVSLLFKHFFEDLGFPQFYFNKYITIIRNDTHIDIKVIDIKIQNFDFIPQDAEEFRFDKHNISLIFENDNCVNYVLYIEVNKNMEFNFVEKMLGIIFTKIILILKHIIENYI